VTVGLAIEKADFERGKPARALSDRILEFLAMNSGNAYLEEEISKEMMQADPGDRVLQSLTIVGRQAVVLAALDTLVRDGKIIARIPGMMPYYMARTESASTNPSSNRNI
jgi:hypothetical protein